MMVTTRRASGITTLALLGLIALAPAAHAQSHIGTN